MLFRIFKISGLDLAYEIYLDNICWFPLGKKVHDFWQTLAVTEGLRDVSESSFTLP